MDGKLVLLVEDDASDEVLTLRALQRSNVTNEVVVRYDAQSALDFLSEEMNGRPRAEWHLPSLIILDLKLPGMTGLEFLRSVKNHDQLKFIPVVVATSSVDPKHVEATYALGANSFVRKPMDPRAFADTMFSVCMYWLLLNQCADPVA